VSDEDSDFMVIDTETYPNASLWEGKDLKTGEIIRIWMHEPDAPRRIAEIMARPGVIFIGFNSYKFDFPVISAMMLGKDSMTIKHIANMLIQKNMPPWMVEGKFKVPPVHRQLGKYVDHIDLFEVAPGFVGLKTYGARMHAPKLQDNPFAHDKVLTPDEFPKAEVYCDNDLDLTERLFKSLEEPLLLRHLMSKEYKVDMRSKSDSQMAEAAFVKKLGLERRENVIPSHVNYKAPTFISFKSPYMAELLRQIEAHDFMMNQNSGHVTLPDFLKLKVTSATGEYQLGVGGIHSVHDRKVCHLAQDGWKITDIDAASYYPAILLEHAPLTLLPAHLGQAFLDEYRRIFVDRLAAKKVKNKSKADTLRIALNGTFGKTASWYSILYAPGVMLFIVLTGQLTLFMLIEELEEAGAIILSANTDGIAIKYREENEERIQDVVAAFGEKSKFMFEATRYRVLAMKDVNNYIAVKTNREIKAKGIYGAPDLRKNPTASICARAVEAWLSKGVPLAESIRKGAFKEYVSARNVTGGGMQGDEYLGKTVRWYQTTDKSLPHLTYAKNGNKVPKSEGARACMIMDPEGPHPEDLDYTWYNREAIRIASDIGCEAYLTPEELEMIAKPAKKSRKKADKEPFGDARWPGGSPPSTNKET
jgi:hypothetical protein